MSMATNFPPVFMHVTLIVCRKELKRSKLTQWKPQRIYSQPWFVFNNPNDLIVVFAMCIQNYFARLIFYCSSTPHFSNLILCNDAMKILIHNYLNFNLTIAIFLCQNCTILIGCQNFPNLNYGFCGKMHLNCQSAWYAYLFNIYTQR